MINNIMRSSVFMDERTIQLHINYETLRKHTAFDTQVLQKNVQYVTVRLLIQ